MPNPTPPARPLRPVAALPVEDIIVTARKHSRGWEVAAFAAHESIVLEQVPGHAAAVLVALAHARVRPPTDARIRTFTPDWSDTATVRHLHPVTLSAGDLRLHGLDAVLEGLPKPLRVIKQREPLLVACDASLGHHARGRLVGGIACVTAEGDYRTAPVRAAATINHLELAALETAMVEFGQHRRLHLTSDSRWAVEVANAERAPAVPADIRLARHVHQLIHDGGHTVTWVRGHANDPLNCIADRLAVTIRRAAGFGLDTTSGTRTMLKRIAEDAA